MVNRPSVIILAGPNGSGKSTAASRLLPAGMTFLNADEIAKGLVGYPSAGADLEAGRLLIGRMDERERCLDDFAVETTLASRTLAPRISRMQGLGYAFRLIFLWSPSVDFSIARVASRVRSGGHDIPEATIRRRYAAGLKNFFDLYRPLADVWDVHDNLDLGGFRLIAEGGRDRDDIVYLTETWRAMKEAVDVRS